MHTKTICSFIIATQRLLGSYDGKEFFVLYRENLSRNTAAISLCFKLPVPLLLLLLIFCYLFCSVSNRCTLHTQLCNVDYRTNLMPRFVLFFQRFSTAIRNGYGARKTQCTRFVTLYNEKYSMISFHCIKVFPFLGWIFFSSLGLFRFVSNSDRLQYTSSPHTHTASVLDPVGVCWRKWLTENRTNG